MNVALEASSRLDRERVRPSVERVLDWLADVADPEIPVVSIVDLGIVREVRWQAGPHRDELVVVVTPTYSGCPATEAIADAIRASLVDHGIARTRIETRLAPAWTTDWMSDAAKAKLHAYGIAPPSHSVVKVVALSALRKGRAVEPVVACPRCGATTTRMTSRFGSTPCKALYVCEACREPFDYFKCH